MTRYSVTLIYQDSQGLTCSHCNRAIKNVAVLKDNLTGDLINVGLTCLEHLLSLKETTNKAIVKESKELIKLRVQLSKIQNKTFNDSQNDINMFGEKMFDDELSFVDWQQSVSVMYQNKITKQLEKINKIDRNILKLEA